MPAVILAEHERELYSMSDKIDDLREDLELFHKEIDKLADFIMDEIPGEPSENEGAIECAIRLLKSANDKGIYDIGIGDKLFIYRSKLKVANEYYAAHKEDIDKQVAREQLADKIVKEGS